MQIEYQRIQKKQLAIEFPAYGQERAANELKKRGILISASGDGKETILKILKRDWKRRQYKTLTEEQVTALEKAKEQKEAHGEIETLDTQVVKIPIMQAISKVLDEFINKLSYSRVVFAKLYTEITAADLLNDRVFDEQKVPLLRILTDRGTEYCGKPGVPAIFGNRKY